MSRRAFMAYDIENQIADTEGKTAGKVYDKEVKLTSSQIKTINATPIELVTAPGPGRAIEFISAVFFLDHGGADFQNGGDIVVKTAGGAAVSDVVPASTLINSNADATAIVRYGGGVAIVLNAGLTLTNVDAAHTAGNGTLTVKIVYRIHDFN